MAAKFDFLFSHYAGLQQGLARFLVLGMFVPMFVLGTFLVHKGKIESGVVVTVFSCMFMISGAFSALGMRVESLRKGQVAVAKLKHFLDLGMSENTYFEKHDWHVSPLLQRFHHVSKCMILTCDTIFFFIFFFFLIQFANTYLGGVSIPISPRYQGS